MAKVVITVDTDEATIDATINGKTVDNIKSISVYKMVNMYSKDQESEVDVMISSSMEEEGGIKTVTHICCEKTTMGKLAVSLGGVKTEYEGFITNPKPSDKIDFSSAGKAARDSLMKGRK